MERVPDARPKIVLALADLVTALEGGGSEVDPALFCLAAAIVEVGLLDRDQTALQFAADAVSALEHLETEQQVGPYISKQLSMLRVVAWLMQRKLVSAL